MDRLLRQHDKLEATMAGKKGVSPLTDQETDQHLRRLERNRAMNADSPGATHGSVNDHQKADLTGISQEKP
ncbi:hypothetical protein MMC30_000880 [Trapelia coarctata]|nr:hypothetical protein [Trapelia coarctata]